MISNFNKALIHLKKRAESQSTAALVQTFVDAGPLESLITTLDHQIIFGRRGIGKTHALQYLTGHVEKKGGIAIYVDLRNIGSSGSIYNDLNLPLAERGTRLLCDVLTAIHSSLLDYATRSPAVKDLGAAAKILDDLATEIVHTEVVGKIEVDRFKQSEAKSSEKMGGGGTLKASPDVRVDFGAEESMANAEGRRTKQNGVEMHHLKFGAVAKFLESLAAPLGIGRIWILLDEWAHIPQDLQPLLGDLVRRTLLPVRSITVKIGAVEHRSQFRVMKVSYV